MGQCSRWRGRCVWGFLGGPQAPMAERCRFPPPPPLPGPGWASVAQGWLLQPLLPPCLLGEPHLPVEVLPPPPGPDWLMGPRTSSPKTGLGMVGWGDTPHYYWAKSDLTWLLLLEAEQLSPLLLT